MAEISIAYCNNMVVAKPLCDDDEEEGKGRILTVEEFMERLRNRSDIFGVDKNHRLRNAEIVALLFAVAAGLFVSYWKPMDTVGKLLLPLDGADCPPVTIRPDAVAPPSVPPKTIKPPSAASRILVAPPAKKIAENQTSLKGTGGGSARNRIAQTGVLGILADKIRGKDVALGDLLGKGGFAEGIDAVFQGIQGIKQGSSALASRPGVQIIGMGPGYGPGFNGDGPGGVDDLIQSLMKPVESEMPLTLKTGPPDRLRKGVVTQPHEGVALRGESRSKSEIMRVVIQNINALRYAYNQRLRDRPGLTGRITIKFAVDEFGSVIVCEVVGSSLEDRLLETNIVSKILRWRFDKIDKPGDITEVVYPFVFST